MEKEKPQKKAAKVLERIIEKRQELGITQKSLALDLYLSSNGYFKVEKGYTSLSVLRLLEIAEALKANPCDFFEDL
ncbi:helix-turn-helix domain-containing protein [Polaribacter gochangensis]|uniref:helix-turn-helix domain-containing protein n=1 Tax=Polaribacter gochangensis TaxID=3252903 RepID=UPI003904ACDB